jgi:hypothetical protein
MCKTCIRFFIIAQIGAILVSCKFDKKKDNCDKSISFSLAGYPNRIIGNESNYFISFNQFIYRFSSDSVFQINHCLFPIKFTSLIDPVEDIYSIDFIERDNFNFIDLPITGNKFNRYGYYTIISSKQRDKVNLQLRHNDNGIHINYIFSFQNKKWLLVEVLDEST